MASAAKGGFPGKPRKKIYKKAVKFRRKLQKLSPKDVLQMCAFVSDSGDLFQNIFDDENDQDVEFVGFSSEECGLCAYKRVSKPQNSLLKSPSDILGSNLVNRPSSKDKVVTRLSFALDNKIDDHDETPLNTTSVSVKLTPLEPSALPKESLSPLGAGSFQVADAAFMKYKDTKLDFHRLSKKARNRESYEDCSAEEQAKRKDTSTASLKYASEIYLAQGGSATFSPRSPIKPATFIPPTAAPNADMDSTSIKGGQQKNLEERKKGAGHPTVLAKALLTRASRSLKSITDNHNVPSSISKSSKSPLGFNLPTKSVRSSRIIKANRRYVDDAESPVIRKTIDYNSEPFPKVVPVPKTPSEGESSMENVKKETKISSAKKLVLRPTRFRVPDENTPEVAPAVEIKENTKTKTAEKSLSKSRSRSFIKRARFKHPTSSDALVLGSGPEREAEKANINPIREATFTAPTLKKRNRDTKKKLNLHKDPSLELSDLGISSSNWEKLYDANGKKWTVGSITMVVPPWTRQEIHNLLHGAHTFGTTWSSIARHYDFHEQHRDWLGVCYKVKKCRNLGYLNDSFKVKSSILLQLKPKLSSNPNVTVFTAAELKVRGLKANVPCSYRTRGTRRCPIKDVDKNIKIEPSITSPAKNRIFGTQLSGEHSWTKVKLMKISKEDLYLGLSAQSMLTMLMPRKGAKKYVPWAPWEIHNILHGVHYFGIGDWMTIWTMYQFLDGHDNLDVRARFKSVCCRGLIVANDVRSDVLPRLHVVLSKEGKEYFRTKKIPVTICSLSKKSRRFDSDWLARTQSKARLKPLETEEKMIEEIEGDDISISPPRRAVHIFGSAPLWDDPVKPELIASDDEAAPVINALESSLRENLNSPTTKRRASYDDVITSPSSYDVPIALPVIKKTPEATSKRNRSKSESQTTPVKSKSRGPRIKHVCRRASLVTGHSLATTEDERPHLTALPQEEREKVLKQSEKQKNADLSSDENMPTKPTSKPQATVVVKKKSRKRHASRRCGNCSTCQERPCQHCDMCKRCMDSDDSFTAKVLPCTNRKPCLAGHTPENNGPSKKSRKSLTVSQPASRKSTRLQQQLAPLVAPPIVESLNLATVEAPPFLDATTLPYDSVSSPDSWGDFSPFSKAAFDRLNSQCHSLIKTEDWKATYDHDLLWKNGGQALITSQPAPPRVMCLLCGSRGHPDEEGDRLIHCCSCCDAFHSYCADSNYEHPVVKKSMENGTWFCKRCKLCSVCGASGKMVECRVCVKNFHVDCLGPTYPTKFTGEVWICMQCITCKSCGAAKPGNLGSSNWTHDYTMCQKCGDLYDKGNYCSICQRCYSDEDYDCRMIQCAKCKRWIHSTCENLTVEMYTLLSHMPDSVQYKCPACDGRSKKLGEDGNCIETSNNQLNVDKIRSSLSQLPPPLWRKLIEKEMQGGLETIIMSLFHNEATCSVLKKNEQVPENDEPKENLSNDVARPRDLFAIRFAVHNQRYHSIGQFCNEVKNVIKSVSDEAERLKLEQIFTKESGKIFSWFNFETGKVKDNIDDTEDVLLNALNPPHQDHNYAQKLEKAARTKRVDPTNDSKHSDLLFDEPEDMRQCIFCSQYGDDMAKACGRLLYCGQDEWTHVNCALWSAEVFEQHDGSLKNVHSAASRGKMMKCEYCRVPGATIGCNNRGCPKNYHFQCARLAHCAFQQDKKVYCKKHEHVAKSKLLLVDDEFEVERLVSVDNEETRPSRRWQNGVPSKEVFVTIGSLTVQQLGHLSLSSDSPSYLKPISYRIARIFWSSVDAGKKTVYTITISENSSANDNIVSKKSLHHNNHTISHAIPDDPKPDEEIFLPKSPLMKSPPAPRRTNLVERMDSDPHIGPLSPTRRIAGAPLPPQERMPKRMGTYSIISSINRTLPQAITPFTNRLTYVTNYQPSASSTPVVASPLKISPENPFLNVPPSKPVILNTSDTSVKPILSDPKIAKLSPKSLLTTKPKTLPSSISSTSIPDSTPSFTFSMTTSQSKACETSSVGAQMKPSVVSPKNTPQLSESITVSSQDKVLVKKPAKGAPKIDLLQAGPSIKQGTSGSALLLVPVSTSQSISSEQNRTKDVSEDNPKNQTCLRPLVSNVQSGVVSKTFAVSKSSVSSSENCAPKSPAVISLIQGARNAVDIEKNTSVKISAPTKVTSSNKTLKTHISTPYELKWTFKDRIPTVRILRERRKSLDCSEEKFDKLLEEAISSTKDDTVTTASNQSSEVLKNCNIQEESQSMVTKVKVTESDDDSFEVTKDSSKSPCSRDVALTHSMTSSIANDANCVNQSKRVQMNTTHKESFEKQSKSLLEPIFESEKDDSAINSADFDCSVSTIDKFEDMLSYGTTEPLSNGESIVKLDQSKAKNANALSKPIAFPVPVEIAERSTNHRPADECDLSHFNSLGCSSPEISDDEMVFCSKNLRSFALKTSESSISTRSRSRSLDVQFHAKLKNSRLKTPTVNIEKSRRLSDSESGVDNTPISVKADTISLRRYPRRNTHTCLKSFSGLSPNYALASYAHQEKKAKSERKKRKRGRPRLHSVSKINPSKTLLKATKKADENAGKRLSDASKSDMVCEVILNRSDFLDKPDVATAFQKIDCISEVVNHPNSHTSGLDTVQDITSRKYAVKCLLNDILDNVECTEANDSSILKPNNATKMSILEAQDDFSVFSDHADIQKEHLTAVTTKQSKNLNDLEKSEIKALTDEEETIQKTNEASLSSENKNLAKSDFPDASMQDLLKNITSESKVESCLDETLDSIEELRGGSEDTPLVRMNTSADSLQDSMLESTASLPDANMNSNQVSITKASVPASKFVSIPSNNLPNFRPVLLPPGKASSSTSSSSDYPVLSADDVRTVLERSSSTLTGKQVSPSANQSNLVKSALPGGLFTVSGCSNPPAPQRSLFHQTQVGLFPGKIVGNPVPPRPTPAFMGRVPLISAVNVPLFVSPQPRGAVPVQSPILTLPYRSPIQSPLSVSYSMKVTMAMANTINSGNLRAQPTNSPKGQRFQAPFSNLTSSPQFMRAQFRPRRTYQRRRMKTPRPPKSAQMKKLPKGVTSEFSNVPVISLPPPEPSPLPALVSLPSQPVNELEVSSLPKPPPLVPLTPRGLSVGEMTSLERLIDFYSTKNQLSSEEKAIVRSIITSQIKANQLPSSTPQSSPSIESKKTKTTQSQPSTSTSKTSGGSSKKTITGSKKRPSRDQSGSSSKKKRKQKLVVKKDCDEVLELNRIAALDNSSFLCDVYQQRQKIAKKHSKSLPEILFSYNIFLDKKELLKQKENRLSYPNTNELENERSLVYEIKSDDGYNAKGTDLQKMMGQLLTSIHDCWSKSRSNFPHVALHSIIKAHDFVSLSHDAVRFLVEQLPGARHCPRYKAKYHKHKKTKDAVSHINPHGCCRAEQYKGRSKPDMFGFLASKHRLPPEYLPDKTQSDDMLQFSNRRATSMESLPMAMRFRHLRTFSRQAVGVYRSSIHGRGLYCMRDIEPGEMIMEYTGQTIRKDLTDKREQYYESKSIGCYMFRMDDLFVVDATVMGSAARFINHSCDPNCYSRIVNIEGKKHIVIFALRKIYRGEEFTYDYKFPIEDETHKITCNCGSKQCRKYMN